MTETADGGVDTVHTIATGATIIAPSYVERIVLDDAAASAQSGQLVYGNGESNVITFAAGAAHVAPLTLWGFGGDDMLHGATGADQLHGGSGVDFLYGHDGNDVLFGGDGIDTVSFAGAAAGVSASLDAAITVYSGEAMGDVCISVENMLGSSFGDALWGDKGANTIVGAAGDDMLYGGAGNDVLIGGTGDDVLINGAGADAYAGGAGDDKFVFHSGDAGVDADRITDFGDVAGNDDTLTLWFDPADVTLHQFGAAVRLDLTQDDGSVSTVVVYNMTVATLTDDIAFA